MEKRTTVITVAGCVVLVALLALTAKACESAMGGPVRTTEDLRAYVRATTDAGNTVYLALSPAPRGEPYPVQEGSSSCVDDFGFDDGDVTRDEPAYSWQLDFASPADYRAAMKALAARWRKDGREVEKTDTGITTVLDDGIRVTFHRNLYTDEPELRATGECMRYRDTYGDSYDYRLDKNGDGTVDEDERREY
ncbi:MULTISPECIES: hypothetical protein [Streptomyces]|uniref:Lipoprotein n=1 Tax=Streptomyces fuscus TaxID=3048495 RepID=A0ABT7IV65_9ACTN|nr:MULTISPECIES: hypothetical protein [Streptomyces]MCM1975392.1 hypothetical protein [Streptomyces sp. G1]MDL2076462.1 hypothetical protein [Streptomyces fuscus]SBT91586.1 hypothetical protein GA0115233_103217 [Streptomyces sp. DI166]